MKYLLLFLFIVTALNVCSQEVISGKVYSLETGDPIEGVAIYWKETTLGTVSDVNGDFEIQLIELPAELVFQYLGYKTDILTIRESRFIDHKLSEIEVEALD